MALKHSILRFLRTASAHDAVLCAVVCVCFFSCAGFVAIASDLLGSSIPSSVCVTSSTVFTTFAADKPC